MKKFARATLVTAMLGGSLFASAAPASATCHPEKPSTCEPVNPIEELLERCGSNLDPGLPVTVGVCDL